MRAEDQTISGSEVRRYWLSHFSEAGLRITLGTEQRAGSSGASRPFLRGITLALLAFVLSGLFLWSAPAQAQTTTILVKNTGQQLNVTVRDLDSSYKRRAQAFTTGSNINGFTLNSIGFLFDTIDSTSTAGSQLTVTLNASSSGNPDNPGTVLCTLANPESFSASGVHTFSAPTTGADLCPSLTQNTTYLAVIERGTITSDRISLKVTNSSAEDAGGEMGWSIANSRRQNLAGAWSGGVGAHQIEVEGTGTIVRASFGSAVYSASEGDTVTVKVQLSYNPGRRIVLPLTTTNQGGATSADYSGVPPSVTFESGQTEQYFTFSATDDILDDDGESVKLGFSTLPVGVTAGDNDESTVSIIDNDMIPTITIVAERASVEEGSNASFTLSRKGTTTDSLVVDISVADPGNFLRGNHWETAPVLPEEVTFQAGSGTSTLTLQTKDDLRDIPNAALTVTIATSTAYWTMSGFDSAAVTVSDNDVAPTLELSISSTDIFEGSSLEISLVRTGDTRNSFPLQLQRGYEGATSTRPFTMRSGTTKLSWTVYTTDNDLDELDRTYLAEFSLAHDIPSGAESEYFNVLGSRMVSAIVRDNDLPLVRVTALEDSYEESATSTGVFRITKFGVPGGVLEVNANISQKGNDVHPDHQHLLSPDGSNPTTWTIRADERVDVSIRLASNDGDEDEGAVTMELLPGDDYRIDPQASSATYRVIDTDPSTVLSLEERFVSVEEGGGALNFKVVLDPNRPTLKPVSVDYATSGGTATSSQNADFTMTAGTLTFIPGVTSSIISVPITDDIIAEDDKSFNLTLSNPVNAEFTRGQTVIIGVGTIEDDEPTVSLTARSPEVQEGSVAVFVIKRIGSDENELTVYVAPLGSATQQVTIAAGSSESELRVPTENNDVDENDRTMSASLVDPEPFEGFATYHRDSLLHTASVTIKDNDLPIVTIKPDHPYRTEGQTAVFTLIREGLVDKPLDVKVSVTFEGTEQDADDILTFPPLTTRTIPAGNSTVKLFLGINANTIDSSSGDFLVQVAVQPSTSAYRNGNPDSASVPIFDVDFTPHTVSIEASEGVFLPEGEEAVFVLTRSGGNLAATSTVSVQATENRWVYRFLDPELDSHETHTVGDFDAVFEPGATTTRISVPTGDEVHDGSSLMKATIEHVATSQYAIDPDYGEASIWIRDDDIPTVMMDVAYREEVETESPALEFAMERTGTTTAQLPIRTRTVAEWRWPAGVLQPLSAAIYDEWLNPVIREGVLARFNVGTSTATFPRRPGQTGPLGSTVNVRILPFYCPMDVPGDCSYRPQYIIGSPASTTVELLNNTTAVRVAADQQSVTEGQNATFTLHRYGGFGQARVAELNVRFLVTQNGEFIATSTVSLATSTLTFGPANVGGVGELVATTSVSTIDDSIHEADGTIILTILPPDPVLFGVDEHSYEIFGTETFLEDSGYTNIATVEVLDNDPLISVGFERGSHTVAEGATTTVKLALSEGLEQDVAIPLISTDRGGANSNDYSGVPESVTFLTGETEKSFTFTAVDDEIDDDGESVELTLGILPEGVVASSTSATSTIIIDDDDLPQVTVRFERSSYTVAEGATTSITVFLSEAPERDLVIPLTSTGRGGATSADHSGVPASLRFASDETEMSFTFTALQDEITDRGESVSLAFDTLPTGVSAGTITSTTVSITDNSPVAVGFATSTHMVAEGETTAIKLVLSTSLDQEETIPLTRVHRGGASTTDYDVPEGVTFQSGETERIFTFTAVDDEIDDDGEGVELTLGALPEGVTASRRSATISITDDDDPPVSVSFATSTHTVAEGATTTVRLTLSVETDREVTIPLISTDRGGASSTDYSGVPESVTFQAGDAERSFTFTAVDDEIDDDGESVQLTLGTLPAGVNEGSASETIIWIRDDDVPSVTVGFATSTHAVPEGATTTIRLTLSAFPEREVIIPLVLTEQGGASNSDYSGVRTSVTFMAGETERGFTFTAVDDDIDDDGESLNITFGTLPARVSAGTVATTTVSITDDDTAGVIVMPTSLTVTEGSTSTYSLVLGSEPIANVTIEVSGHLGTDVTVSTTTLVFTSDTWSQGQSVTVTAGEDPDAVAEPEVVLDHVVTGTGEYATITADSVTVTIVENDVSTLSVSPASADEGDGHVEFEVTISAASDATTTVNYATSDGTATAGQDYTSASSTLTFPANSTSSLTISVAVIDDTVDEDEEETFTLTLSNATGAELTGGETTLSVTVTIVDNDDPQVSVSFATSTQAVDEGATTTITVLLSKNPEREVVIPLILTEQGAASNSDYSGVPENVTFQSTETEMSLTFVAVDDEIDDDGESVRLTFGVLPARVSAGTVATTTVSITDNDTAGATVMPESLTLMEGSTSTYSLVLDSEPSANVTIEISGHLGTDVTVSTTTLVFTSDTWSQGQSVTVTAGEDPDAVAEPEVVLDHVVTGTGEYATITVNSVTVTIVENDVSTLSVGPARADEGDGSVEFEVTISAASDATTTVDYATSDGTATSGDDYTAASSTLMFPANSTSSLTISVAVIDDTVDEDEEETFTLTLSNAAGAELAGGVNTLVVTGTIVDNDDPQVSVGFATSTHTVAEGATTTIRLTLSAEPEREVTIPLILTDLGGASSTDYSGVPENVTFQSTETELSFTFAAVDDEIDDDGESVELTFGVLPARVSAGTVATTTVTITDNDDPQVSIGFATSNHTVAEGATTTITVLLSKNPEREVVIPLISMDHGGASTTDYSGVPENVTFQSGETEKSFSFTAVQDETDDDGESVELTFGTLPDGVTASSASATTTVSITDDDDPQVTVSFATSTHAVAEGATTTIRLTLSAIPEREVVIPLISTDQGGASTTDYSGVPENVTFQAGETESSFTFTAVDDQKDDDGESVELTFGTLPARVTASSTSATTTVTISDDDMAGVTVAPTLLTVTEGSTSTYSVVLDSEPTATTTIEISGHASTDLTLSTTTLTFTSDTWSQPKIVTVTGAADEDAVADPDVTLSHVISSAGDMNYDALASVSVTVTIVENDTAGVTIEPTLLTVTEGSTSTYSVVLDSEPTASVTIEISGHSGTDVTLSTTTLMFTSDTWSQSQAVTVTATEDEDAAADPNVKLSHMVTGIREYQSVTADPVTVTIVENDVSTLSVDNARAGEGDGHVVFEVTISAASDATTTVDYATSDGTATAGDDYTAASSTLMFPANSTSSLTISVAVIDDAVDEDEEETFTLTLSNATGAELAGGETTLSVTGTIVDNDDPQVSVNFATSTHTVAEGATTTIRVTLSAIPEREVTIPLILTDQNGASSTDYGGVPTDVTFQSGETESIFTFTAVQDDIDDDGESVELTFGTLPARVSVGTVASTTVSITDDDTAGVTVAPTSLSVTEGSTSTYSVVLDSEPTATTTIEISGHLGTDVTVSTTTLTFTSENWSQSQAVTVTAAEDLDAAADPDVILDHTVTGTGEYATTTAESVTVTIVENDVSTLSVDNASAGEGDGHVVFEVTTSVASDATTTVDYATSDGTATAGEDYTATSSTLAFPANSTSSLTISVSVIDDTIDEDEGETFTLTLSNASGAELAGGETTLSVTGTIVDNDDPQVSVGFATSTYAVDEGATTTITVLLSENPEREVIIPLIRTDRGGASSTDYSGVPTDVTFQSGETESVFTFTAVQDDIDDDDESVELTFGTLPDGVMASSTSATTTVTITDDDTAGVTVEPTLLTVTEGSTSTYSVVLDSEPTATTTIEISGHASSDLTLSTTTLVFTSDSWSEAHAITVTASEDLDAAADPDVVLGHAVTGTGEYSTITADSVTVTIVENDVPALSVDSASADEDDGHVVFEVTISVASDATTTVDYATSDGTAIAGEDYTAASSTLMFPANSTSSLTISVAVIDDMVDEDEEGTFTLTLSNASGAELAGGETTLSVTGTIVDNDDPQVSVSFATSTLTVAEGATTTITVLLSKNPEREVVIPLPRTDQNGASSTDYSGVPGNVTFQSTETEKSFIFTAVDDEIDDDGESVRVTFGTLPARVSAGSAATTTVSITDDDTAGVTIDPTSLTVTEGSTSTYSVRLDTQPTVNVNIEISGHESTDVTVSTTTLTFTSDTWSQEQTVTLTAEADDDAAADPDVTLDHVVTGTGEYQSVTADSVTVTIVENDVSTLSVGPASAAEGDGHVEFEVTISADSDAITTVDFATSDGTATAGDDYTATSSTLAFPANSTSSLTISVPVIDDTVDEDEEETFTLTLGNASGAELAGGETTLSVTGTITDNDDPQVSVAFATSTHAVAEGATTTITVVLSGNPEREVIIPLIITDQNGASFTDYGGVPTDVTFQSGDTEKSFTFTAVQDDIDDDDESVELTFGTLPARVSAGSAATTTVSITDDDTAGVTVDPTLLTVTEGSTSTYSVVLDSEPTATTTIVISGHLGTDVSLSTTMLTFTSDTWSQEQTVTLTAEADDDAAADPDVTLTHVVTGIGEYQSVTADSVTVTIVENDVPTLSVDNASAAEGDGSVVFEVTISAASGATTTVDYATSDGTATAGQDYTASSSTLAFPANSTSSLTISVPVIDDTVDEDEEETFTLTLSNASGAELAGGETTLSVTGTITDDDDPQVSVSFATSTHSVSEGGSLEVKVTLSLDPEREVVIPLILTDRGGAGSADYSGVPTSVTFQSTETEKSFTFTAVDDEIDDDGESVELTFRTLPERVTSSSTSATTTVTITDDDTAGVTIAPTSLTVTEGSTSTYSVVLDSESTANVTIEISGHASTDLTLSTTTLVFTSDNWNQAQAITVTAEADDDAAADPDVTLSHVVTGTGEYQSVTADSVTVTIVENDVSTLSVGPASAGEGDGHVVFEVTISAASDATTTVDYATSDGTATAGDDYTAASSTLMFPANSTSSLTISVAVIDDTVDEDEEETFTLTLGNASGAELVGGEATLSVTGTIVDNDDPQVTVGFGESTYVVAEGATTTITVLLSENPEREVVIPIVLTNQGGASNSDHSVVPESVTFTSGETERSVTFTAVDDDIDDDGESVELMFGTLPDGVTASSTSATTTVSITDDDMAGVTVEPTSLSVTEGDTSGSSYTAKLDSEPTANVTIEISGHESTDLSLSTTTLVFTSDNWSQEREITVTAAEDDDAVADPDVTLSHSVMGTGEYQGVTADSVTVTIVENDVSTLSVGSASAGEGDGHVVFEVTISAASDATTTVDYATSDGTATAGQDYTAASSTLVFPPNSTSSLTISVAVIDDTVDEDEEETFTLTLGNASGAELAGGEATLSVAGTIVDDDVPSVTVSFATSTHTVGEGATTTISLTLSADPEREVVIPLVSTNLGGASSTDYSGVPTSVTFQSTETEKSFTFAAVDDEIDDDGESVRLTFGVLPARVSAGTVATTTVSITDDDTVENDVPTLSVGSASAGEGDGHVVFEVTISTASDATTTVDYATSDGTATVGQDYTAASSTLVFPPNSTSSLTISVAVIDDTVDEDEEETFTLTLSNATGAELAGGETTLVVTGTIVDNDAQGGKVTLLLSPSTIDESGTDNVSRVTASLDAAASATTTVAISTSPTSAAWFNLSVNRTLTIAAGDTTSTGTVTITAVDDNDYIGNRQVTVSGSASNDVGVTNPDDVLLTITEDDDVPVNVSFEQGSYTVTEGSGVAVTVTLSAPPERNVQVPLIAVGRDGATPADYSVPASVSFGAAETQKSFTFTAVDDNEDDDGERVELSFGSLPPGVNDGAITITTVAITDNDDPVVPDSEIGVPKVTLMVTPSVVTPGVIEEQGGDRPSTTTITASMDVPSGAETTVTISTSPSSATWMSVSANRELVIPAGSSTSTGVVTITALNDGSLAGHRVITVEGVSRNSEGVDGPDPVRVTVLASDLDVIPYPENGTRAVTGFTSTDPEVGLPGEGIDWDLTGVDADDFLIDPRGLLIFRRPPDYEAPTDRGHSTVVLDDDHDIDEPVERIGSTPADNLYRITVRATEQRTGGNGHRALVSESDFTIMVTNVNESPEVTMNRLQPEVGTPITATLSDPDGEIDTDGTVGDGKDEVTLGWRWYTSKVQDPVASVDSHWAVATGEGSDSATYTPAGVRIDGTASYIVDEGRYLRVIVTYLDMGVSDTDDGVTTSMVRRATGVSAHPVRAEVSTDMDGVASTENGSPGFNPSADYTRTVSEHTPVGAPVGDPVVAVDPDDDILTYELDDDRDADAPDRSGDVGYFTIDLATGQLEVAMPLSYEDHLDGYEFYVRATDPSGESATVMVTVIAEDENDPPVIMGSSAGGDAGQFPRAPTELRVYEMDEDDRDAFDGRNDMMMIGMPGSGVGASNVFTAIDEDLRDQVTWEIEGEDVDHFVLSSSGVNGPGQPIALLFREPPGYEVPSDSNMDNVYKVTLIARDSDGGVAVRPLSVFVDNVEERGEAVFLEEQPLIGTPISVSVNDPDTYQALVTWQWMRAPTTESEFSVIPGATGPTYTPVEDDGGHYLRAFATYIDSTSHTDDPDTYDVDERTQKMNGTGHASPREATMTDGSETDSDRLYRVMATSDYAVRADPDGSANDTGEMVFPSQDMERSVAENAEAGTIVGAPVQVVPELDEDGNPKSTFRYDLEDTPTGDDRYFTIDADSGQIRVGEVGFPPQTAVDMSPVPGGETAPDTADPVLDHEDDDTFTLVVTAVDTEDSSRNAVTTVTVSLIDLNERPYFDRASRDAVADPVMYGERRVTEIIRLAAVEPDGDELLWELTGPDADHLVVVDAEDSGGGRDRVALEFRARPDYEKGRGSATSTGGRPGDTYLVTLRATETSSVGDGPLMAAELPVRVQVVNADEPGRADFSLLQPEVGTPITATTTDADGVVGPVTYTWYRAKVTEPHRDIGPDHDLSSEWVQLSAGTSGTGDMTYTPQGVLRADDGTSTGSEMDEGRYLLAKAIYVDGTGATTTALGITAHPVRADVSDALNNSPDFSVGETAREVPEDTAVGMAVGAPVQVATVEDGEVLTYSLDDDADAGNSLDTDTDLRFFSIDRATGQIMVRTPLSAEATDGRNYTGPGASTAGEYAVYARATNSSGDTGGEDSDVIRVVVTATDVNEAPTITGRAELSVSEFDSTNDDHYVGLGNTEDDDGSVTLNATTTNLYRAVEEDRDNIVTWPTPIAGPDGALFEYSTSDGGRRLHFISPPDFEHPGNSNRDNMYEVTLVAAGSEGETAEKSVRITVLNVDEAGTLTLLPEQPMEGSPVTAVLTDPDGVVSITDWEWFATSTSSRAGAVRVSGASASEYTGTVGNFIWASVSYRDGASVEDDPVTALDERNDNPSTEAVIEQHRLQYRDDSGALDAADSLFHNSDEVSEGGTEYAVQAAPTAGVQFDGSGGRVEVLELTVPENTPSTGYVGTPLPGIGPNGAIQGIDASRFVLAEDMDDNGSAYYDSLLAPLVDDEDDKVGQLAAAAVTHFDYEDKNTYTIEVVDPDPQAEVSMYRVTIMVMDVNEPPTPPREYRGLLAQNTAPDFGVTSTIRYVEEGTAPGTDIGDPVTATDVDRGDQETLVYTLGGPDAASFTIDPDTGQLMTSAVLAQETKSEYTVEVTATDDEGAAATIVVTITVTSVDAGG